MKSCTRYNRRQQWNNLLEDCTAGDELVPRRTLLLLEHHTDEVWHIQFSGCGKMLASGSKDKTVIIWSLYDKPLIKHHLKQHTDAVSYVAWSPDDKWLVSGVLRVYAREREREEWRPHATWLVHVSLSMCVCSSEVDLCIGVGGRERST